MIRPLIADIITIASRLTDTPESDIRGGASVLHLCAVRHAVYATAREWGYSLPAIGRAVGGRDHSTVFHSLATHRRYAHYVENFDGFCAAVARYADELPPFVAETDWAPDCSFTTKPAEWVERERKRVPRGSKPPAHKRKATTDYDMLLSDRADASVRQVSAALAAALARAA